MLALDTVDVPVIHDVHDMQSLRRTPYEDGYPEPKDPLALERRAAEESAALVTISPELVAELAARYRLPRRVLAYANYALARDLPAALPAPRPLDGPPRLVYQGTLSTNGGHYDLRDLFAAIAAQGLSLDVYPAREVPEYREIPGIRVHETLPLPELLRRAAGLRLRLGGLQRRAQRRRTSTPRCPNKLYEYLGCGLPVITLRHRALRRMLSEEGVGIALDDVGELAAALADGRRRRAAAAGGGAARALHGRGADRADRGALPRGRGAGRAPADGNAAG